MKVKVTRLGIVFAVVLGLWHASWATLVAVGWAQPVLDFVLKAHYLKVPVTVEPFDLEHAYILIGMTMLLGFVIGVVGGTIWNASRKQR